MKNKHKIDSDKIVRKHLKEYFCIRIESWPICENTTNN